MARTPIALSLCAFLLLTTVGARCQQTENDEDSLTLNSRVIPIPQQLFPGSAPKFIGSPAVADPISAMAVPESPFMAPNGVSSLHLNGYQTDTYTTGGPLGRKPEVTSTFLAALCGTVTFDTKGRIEVVCINTRPVLYILDPVSLAMLAKMPLPKTGGNGTFGAGGYFFTDQAGRAVIPTRTHDVWRVATVDSASGPQLVLNHSCGDSLTSKIPGDQDILSVFPDANGLLWVTTSGNLDSKEAAMVFTVKPDETQSTGCTVQMLTLPGVEIIKKSFAVDPDPSRGGVFIVSDHNLYRFDASSTGAPTMTWSQGYNRGVRIKPGQIYQGSGTTPTLMGTDMVTIADNADPRMNVDVFLRSKAPVAERQVCSVPVFQPLRSDSFNSLIATESAISVENNYGYAGFASTLFGLTTVPGITRIDLDSTRTGCSVTWTNTDLSVPNIVSQASLANGLEYAYTKAGSFSLTDAWYFTAVDFRTGKMVYQQLAGTGILYDSHYSGLYLGPDGKTAYIGVTGGLVRIHDTY